MNAVAEVEDPMFVDVMACAVHDIKNSIGLLLDSADGVAAVMSANGAGEHQLGSLQCEARRINYDLMHLLGLYKAERAGFRLHAEVVNCEELLEEVHAFNVELLARRGIALHAHCGSAVEGFFDRELVRGVVNSIVNNAFKHAISRVEIGCEVHDGYTVLSVDDDGAGYAPKLLAANDLAPGPSNYRSGNTGLGLFFARRIAALHEHRGRRGRIVLGNESHCGGGRFELWLP